MKDNLDSVITDLKNRIEYLKNGNSKPLHKWASDLTIASELNELVSRLQKIKDATQQAQGIH